MSVADLPIPEAGARLRDGSLTAAALLEAHLARIGARDGALRAFVHLGAEPARTAAAAADADLARGIDRGPLHGIPVGLKDLIDTAGVPTRYGSAVFADHVPDADAPVAARLKAGGAVLLGKLATYEFALVGPSRDGPHPPAANPWNPAHITGGSSSGCAAAVGGGLLRTSVGTDTGGSVRSPAGYCGAVGLKPTYRRVGLEGVFPLSPSLDHLGPVSASVAEAALTFDAMAGSDTQAAAGIGRGIEGLRIAYARDFFAGDPAAHPGILRALDAAASTLSLLGARITEVRLPPYALFEAAGAVILHAEALEGHVELLRRHGPRYGRLAFQTLAAGLLLQPEDVARARAAAARLRAHLDEAVFGRFDALLTANTLTPAPPFAAFDGEAVTWTPMRTLPFNVTGHPALAVPAGQADNLPVGLQLVGRAGEEACLCRIGDAFERATDHAALRPPPLPATGADGGAAGPVTSP